MAVIVIDNRILVSEADSTTGWTTSDSFNVTTATPAPKELTASLGFATSESEEYAYHTITSASLGSTLIYVWTLVQGTEQTTSNGGRQIYVGDGTHARGYYVGGSDGAGFRHDSGEVNWQCFLLDTANLPASYTQHAGTNAPTLTTVTQLGVGYVVDSKSLGGGDNTFVDMVLYGNDGLSIVGGTTGDRGTFDEIATIDAANTNYGGTEDASGARSSGTAGSSYGIIRELSSGVYGLSGSLTFGDSAETADSYFDDDGVVVVFENRITSAYWYFDAEGNATYNVTLNLSNSTIKSAGPTITCDFTGGNINTLTFDTVNFVDLLGDIDFSNSADATGHSVTNCSFSNCGEIDPGDVTFEDNTIIDSADSATGAVLLDTDGTSNWSGLSFISGGTGHAIYIAPGATGNYTLTNFSYSGYGADETTNAVVYNNSGGHVNLTISGGSPPTVRNGTSATTSIINAKTITITVKDEATNAVENAQVWIQKASTETTEKGHPANPYTSHATNNSQGDTTFDIADTIEGDNPTAGWLVVKDVSEGTEHTYRYASRDTSSTFTLRSTVTGTISAPSLSTIDSYSESNVDAYSSIGGGGSYKAMGQSFVGDGYYLYEVDFYARKVNSPTGNCYAKIYKLGSDGLPTGSVVTTSNALDVSTLGATASLETFSFPVASRSRMVDGQDYCVVVEYTGGDGANYIQVGHDQSSPTHDGQTIAQFGATNLWASYSGQDIAFYVKGTLYRYIVTETNISTKDIEEGDTIRNTTDGSWAIVKEVIDANTIGTSELLGGTDNEWQSGDSYSVHTLAIAYVAADTVTVPIMNQKTNASGIATASYNFDASMDIYVRIRKSTTATKYFPYKTTGEITGDFSLTATLIADTIIS